MNDNVHAMFEGGAGQMLATFEEYGKSWVMVRATDAQMDLSDDEDDED